jgi:hypothetical protein
VLPHFDDIAFDSEPSLRTRLHRFINDADARRRLAAAQRASVASRLSYAAGMSRVTALVERGLSRAAVRNVALSDISGSLAAGGRAA